MARPSPLLLLLALTAAPCSSLRCYTCNTTYIHRFTRELSYDDVCSSRNQTGPVVTCSDPREFCDFENDHMSSYQEIRRSGCVIPNGKGGPRPQDADLSLTFC